MFELENQKIQMMLSSIPLCPSQNQATKICLNPRCKLNQNKINDKQIIKEGQDINFTENSKKINQNPFICTDKGCQSCSSQNIVLSKTKNENTNSNNTSQKQVPNPQKSVKGEDESSQGSIKIKQEISKKQTNYPNHSRCFVADYQNIIYCIQSKVKQSQPIKQFIHQIFDKFMDYLSELRDEIIQKYDYYGISDDQAVLLKLHQKKAFHQINSAMVNKVIPKLHEQIGVLQADKLTQKIQRVWEKRQMDIKLQFDKLKSTLSSYVNKQLKQVVPIDSKILREQEQKSILINMLTQDMTTKQVPTLKLLYRASQHQFLAKDFHERCDSIKDTVTILQTQHGKKIGGYTPLMWDKNYDDREDKDPSQKTFLFSISNNHKFKLKSSEQIALIQYQNHGPTFGVSCSDLYIVNKAHDNTTHGNIGKCYTHPQYPYGQQSSWTKFSGAKNGNKFKTKEWEVFQLIWE